VIRAFASLGSNIDPERYLHLALQELQERYGELRSSSLYRSRAVGFEGEDFLNLVVAFDTEASPEELRSSFRLIEEQLGRRRGEAKFAPRTIDLDLILYGDQVFDRGELKIPRDEITTYAFVLWPLAEIAGEMIHPVLGRSFASIKEELDVEPKDIRVDPGALGI
jgi:2-amino-4-hydroxy-6-hydroxymethyldihydropteridine diphosphokinase